jgi:hypothetical protein
MNDVKSNEIERSGQEADAPAEPAEWNYRELVWASLFGIGFQGIVLPAFQAIGEARCEYAAWFDALFIVRVLLAYFCREKGKGWMFYSMLILSSAIWIYGITSLALGRQ